MMNSNNRINVSREAPPTLNYSGGMIFCNICGFAHPHRDPNECRKLQEIEKKRKGVKKYDDILNEIQNYLIDETKENKERLFLNLEIAIKAWKKQTNK